MLGGIGQFNRCRCFGGKENVEVGGGSRLVVVDDEGQDFAVGAD
jgi:hypothetical protein